MSTSSTTAGRSPGSCAVETTPAGLFTAQTSRASAADRAAVDPHVVALADVARRDR